MSFENYEEFTLEEKQQIEKLKTMFNAKETKMFDLKDYKPEKVENKDFELIKGKGFVCKVNSSKVEKVEAGQSEDGSRSWDEYNRLKYELEIIDDKGKGFIGRRVWKSYNLDSAERSGKAQKTPVEKLADVFFTVGLEFSNFDELVAANERFAEMQLDVSFSSFKGSDGGDVQMHYVNGLANKEEGGTPAF